MFTALRGKHPEDRKKSNELFTTAVILETFLALVSWLGLIFFDRQLLSLFGANDALMPFARAYLYPVKFGVPCFLFSQMLSAFLRNDGDPGLATKAVLFGGIFNVFGDYFCIFTLNMGIMGAGLATVVGSFFSCVIMMTHFKSKKNTLALVRPHHFLKKVRGIVTTGFSTFFIDIAMGILTVFFNRQILHYLDTNALAVYGIVAYVGTFVQCCAYSVGQASQPLISANLGAGNGNRIIQTLRYALVSAAAFAAVWTALCMAVPNFFIRVLTTPTPELLSIAPGIIRTYGLSFLLLPLNIFSTYYFQALLKRRTSFVVSVSRGCVISGILIYLLPAVFGANAIWLTMPITEFIVAVYVTIKMKQYTKQLVKPKPVPAAAAGLDKKNSI